MNIYLHDKIIEVVDPYNSIFQFTQTITQDMIANNNIVEIIQSNLYEISLQYKLELNMQINEAILEKQSIITNDEQQSILQFNISNLPSYNNEQYLVPEIMNNPVVIYKIKVLDQIYLITNSGQYKIQIPKSVSIQEIQFLPLLQCQMQCISSQNQEIQQLFQLVERAKSQNFYDIKNQIQNYEVSSIDAKRVQFNEKFDLLNIFSESSTQNMGKAQIKLVNEQIQFLLQHGIQIEDLITQNMEINNNTLFKISIYSLDENSLQYLKNSLFTTEFYYFKDETLLKLSVLYQQKLCTIDQFLNIFGQHIYNTLQLNNQGLKFSFLDYVQLNEIQSGQHLPDKVLIMNKYNTLFSSFQQSLPKFNLFNSTINIGKPYVILSETDIDQFTTVAPDSYDEIKQCSSQYLLQGDLVLLCIFKMIDYSQSQEKNNQGQNDNDKLYLVKFRDNEDIQINWVTEEFIQLFPQQLKQFINSFNQ